MATAKRTARFPTASPPLSAHNPAYFSGGLFSLTQAWKQKNGREERYKKLVILPLPHMLVSTTIR
ncbi:hypothetical protein CAI21_05475 [Alkalilimnicola ehrlichii]|uniref:Uncharacterized protein n=1 Tax=Alkalilimnicola ehrlichii TaxID=351052 RepID=A0A3E0WZ10_9GAMM|nr:hypothetical protein CAI21_05475 [Alkalilimnicola ehrlichii]RFA38048.1 hypothetical protein CAL65_06845 [Alkalilimnicola ehrlichii]